MAAPEAAALERLIGFGRELRRRGLAVGTGRIVTFCRATRALGALDRTDLVLGGQVVADLEARGRGGVRRGVRRVVPEGIRLELSIGSEGLLEEPTPTPAELDDLEVVEDQVVASEWHELDEAAETEGEAAIRIVASAMEVLREKSFADLSEEEWHRVALLIRRLGDDAGPAHPPLSTGAVRRAVRRARTLRSLRTQGVSRSTARGGRAAAELGRSC